MPKSNVEIGKNIRDLRNAFGETQEDLGKILGRSKSAISMFESDERQIDNKDIQKIAFHYGIPVDVFLNGDFSDIKIQKPLFTDESLISSFAESIFPLVDSKKALEDPHFAKGYTLTKEIMLELKNSGTLLEGKFEAALDAYSTAYEKSCIAGAAVNMLCLKYIKFTNISGAKKAKIADAIMQDKSPDSKLLTKLLLQYDSDVDGDLQKEKKEYAESVSADLLGYITALKKTRTYSDIADYYLALGHILGLYNTESSDELNRGIGAEMMLSFAKVGNQHVTGFIESFLSVFLGK